MIQFRFDAVEIMIIMKQFNLVWEEDPYGRKLVTWNINLTRVIDAMTLWCKNSGIKEFGIGHTQIELCITFLNKNDAALFKLRWHHVRV